MDLIKDLQTLNRELIDLEDKGDKFYLKVEKRDNVQHVVIVKREVANL